MTNDVLIQKINTLLPYAEVAFQHNELTVHVAQEKTAEALHLLKNEMHFEMLMDLCGIDYLHYKNNQWPSSYHLERSFSRAASSLPSTHPEAPRFGVVYHLLSITENCRIRVLCKIKDDKTPCIQSVCNIWDCANWYEREAYDMFGILFEGHPDLRRILTDYGFNGHPLRKDFPLTGETEVIYSEEQQRVIYQQNTVTPRINTPKILREDNRYNKE